MLSPAIKTIIKGNIAVFRNFELAVGYASRCVKTHWVVLGDNDGDGDSEYWVVSPADAQRLERAGYDMV